MATEDARWIRIVRSFARTAFRHRCPACALGPLFRSGYEMHARCPACDQDLVGVDGAQYGGPIVLGYTVAGVSGLGTIGLLWWRLGYATWQLWTAVAVTCVAVFLTFRHCKAAWTWLLWATGQLGDDAGGAGGASEEDPGGGPDADPPGGDPVESDVRVRWRVRLAPASRHEPAESRRPADPRGGARPPAAHARRDVRSRTRPRGRSPRRSGRAPPARGRGRATARSAPARRGAAVPPRPA